MGNMQNTSMAFDEMNAAPIIKHIAVRSIITKSNLPVADYSVNPYTGCTHACKYCYASLSLHLSGKNSCQFRQKR